MLIKTRILHLKSCFVFSLSLLDFRSHHHISPILPLSRFAASEQKSWQTQLTSIKTSLINMDKLIIPRHHHRTLKDKIVIIMGVTGTGKSRLSIDLAARFDAEIINSDKIQFHRGLNVATNKVTEEETRGVPHHLLGFINPSEDFTARDFVERATSAADEITRRGRLPIIVGGSNSLIEALVSDDVAFGSKYDCCFLWVDVSEPVLHGSVSRRVDRMVDSGLVEECREFFDPGRDYTRGIGRAIGVPELHEYFESGPSLVGDSVRAERLLEEAVERIKGNTCELARRQLRKILRLGEIFGRRMHRLDATEVFVADGEAEEEEAAAWERLVVGPGARIVGRFLFENNSHSDNDKGGSISKERVATDYATSAPRAIVALVGPT